MLENLLKTLRYYHQQWFGKVGLHLMKIPLRLNSELCLDMRNSYSNPDSQLRIAASVTTEISISQAKEREYVSSYLAIIRGLVRTSDIQINRFNRIKYKRVDVEEE